MTIIFAPANYYKHASFCTYIALAMYYAPNNFSNP